MNGLDYLIQLIIISIGLLFVGLFSIGCYLFWKADSRWKQFLMERVRGSNSGSVD